MYHQESWAALDGADGSPCSCSHSYGRQLRINDRVVVESFVNFAVLRGTKGGCLTSNSKGQCASKDWKMLYGDAVTRHSGRRSGALQYIRSGWAVSRVGYLGRWKSNVIMEYAQEALESLAVNNTTCFGGEAQLQLAQQLIKGGNSALDIKADLDKKADAVVVKRLKQELESFKGGTKDGRGLLEKAIQDIKQNMATSAKYLPSLVKSTRQQVVHTNVKTLVYAPSVGWMAKCGWYYYNSNYEFVEGSPEMITCAKCISSAQWQGLSWGGIGWHKFLPCHKVMS